MVYFRVKHPGDLRGFSTINIGGIEYFREVIKCKKRSFGDFDICTKLRYSGIVHTRTRAPQIRDFPSK